MNISPAHILTTIAEIKSQTLVSLFDTDPAEANDFDTLFARTLSSQISIFDTGIPGAGGIPVGLLSAAPGIAGLNAGRNMTLADPESAFRMMSLINEKDSLYKAQVHALSELGVAVSGMQHAGQRLSGIEAGDIKAGLLEFVGLYNGWIERFESEAGAGGLLAGMQAAEISRYELEQSVRFIFIGVDFGFRGLGDLGITVGPDGKLSLDSAKLDAVLAANPQGVLSAVREFGANFARAAEMLNADNNFIPNQLDNLNRAIRFIGDNRDDWQAEFGTGDAARPTGQVAKALAAYEQVGGI